MAHLAARDIRLRKRHGLRRHHKDGDERKDDGAEQDARHFRLCEAFQPKPHIHVFDGSFLSCTPIVHESPRRHHASDAAPSLLLIRHGNVEGEEREPLEPSSHGGVKDPKGTEQTEREHYDGSHNKAHCHAKGLA